MKTKIPIFQKSMAPIVKGLKASVAASIGRTIVRHSYLEWMQAKVIHQLLGISIKQGRLAIRVPRPGAYPDLIENLLKLQGITTDFPFNNLSRKLDAAERARNALAHSIFIKDQGKVKIQLVTGAWDELPQDVVPVKRAIVPQTPIADRAFLNKQRKSVEDAIKMVKTLQKAVDTVLGTLREKRRTEKEWDRRH